jgi:hypothetical protein
MKTPRDLLFQRHRSVEPKLDAVRDSVLATVRGTQREKPAATPKPHYTLRDLLLSCRWHLTAMSAAWLVVLVLNVDRSPGSNTQSARENAAPPRQLMVSLQAYQRQLIELLEPPLAEPVVPPPRRSQFRSHGRWCDMSDGISFFESRRSWNPNGIPAQSPG